ncbi:MAG: disulfide bond formation protein DsbD [Sphingobacteriales bacterium 17-39-43]|uniref:protein-disulfide reductase DsbD family protein n=1 Tax=Daejeonella sp. TaxID=2805397 RepID=UPI000BD2AEFF|nr:thioredoxin family protein [Daejeonella sp.]OYZ32225.1 MAG: disulfide bond formation protein DsbD [Sphingobacteriales bacterium 16-39-50]OZA25570.1 MAG: disulfide bond formation protein DsbD [Sphingobacteriales bacterium 17-39-43]HQT22150.1 cytochrome c biogenesis protein CcdA [Daejeonella sp.]HQT57457.1 cytochrome c biogenesis protein CcdA [Daejeonella sp.]
MKKLLGLIFLFLAVSSQAQFPDPNAKIYDPVKWSFSSEKLNDKEYNLIITAKIEKGWHVYSQFIEEGGPIPTSFKFQPSSDYKLVGKVTESPKAVTAFDKNFNMQIAWHKDQVVFKQKVSLLVPKTNITGTLEFMVCNDERCLPPAEVEFTIAIQAGSAQADMTVSVPEADSASSIVSSDSSSASLPSSSSASIQSDTDSSGGSLWAIFIAGFIGGLAAFFMPCIYPMIPLTVSFFTKKSGSRAKGIQSAIIYGLSIIVIYVALGLLITLIFGASALNEAASSATFNLLFFVVLVIFGISFLGAFEITLPSSLVNKMDEKSNQNGFLGLFFMAFTLALVSFSCTGPIIGTLLVDAVSKGSYLGPAIGMLGFSSALAIPFTLFAIFPSWLKEMPKSGGWLNTVKVSLGFLEIALAFKFLSNVDLAYHWGILNRDIFLIIWIIVFGLWALYLLGKIRLSHDNEINFLSLPRLFFSMLILGFTLYMVPGLWGAPLKAISAWLPPQVTQEFDLYSNRASSPAIAAGASGKKYSGLFHAPHGLDAFYDYEEGLAYAKTVNKPILIDFTGWSCTNCRKMEASVWPDKEVLRRLREDYVLISLYVDDKTELSEAEKYVSGFSGKKVNTIGQKWSDFQASRFGTNSQPYYVIADHEGKVLVPPQAYNLDISNYVNFLDKGKIAFGQK